MLVRDAVSAGLYTGPAQICKELEGNGSVPPSRGTIRRWASGATSPFSGKRIFDRQPSPELSFFLGAWLGDGWADENDGGKRMLLKVRSYDFAKEFADCAARVLHKTDSYWVRRVNDKRGKWYLVKVTSFQLLECVDQPFESLRNLIEPFPKPFLRGIFTAEGNPQISIWQRGGPGLDVGLTVSNSDHALLQTTRTLLSSLNFHPGTIRLNTRAGSRTNLGIASNDVSMMNLSRFEEVQGFARTIGFADPRKQDKLEEAIALVRKLGHKAAAVEWVKLYRKIKGEWVRRET